jgi:hypothetical protein
MDTTYPAELASGYAAASSTDTVITPATSTAVAETSPLDAEPLTSSELAALAALDWKQKSQERQG